MSKLSELLHALDKRWRSLGMPVDELLAPGLAEDVVRSTLSNVTQHLSDEIVDWFAWHNGRFEPRNLVLAAPSGCALLSITEALAERAQSRSVAVEAAATEPELGMAPEEYWPDSWLPIAENGSGGLLVVDVVRDGSKAPARFHDWEGDSVEGASSLVVAAQLWLAVLDTGLYTWAGGK